MTYGSPSIYLDHAATTPVDPRVVESMLPYFSQAFGNPSSIYQAGQDGLAAISAARRTIAGLLGARSSEIVFTSGATESTNLAVRGVAWQARLERPGRVPHVLVSAIEHHAVLHAAESLRQLGFEVGVMPVDEYGRISPSSLEAAIRPNTCLVSVMLANNEIGTIQRVKALSGIAHAHGATFHTDAVQAAGSVAVDVDTLGVDLLSLSAHKFYGPKGVGVLYARRGTQVRFEQAGGGQESGRRAGTENVPLIVGMAEALSIAVANRDAYNEHCRSLRDRLWAGIQAAIPDVTLNGPQLDEHRLSNNLNVIIRGVQGETVLLGLDIAGVAASAGSACTTGNVEPSHVLLAIGRSEDDARSSLRLTVGRGNSEQDVDQAIEALSGVVSRTRALANYGV